MKNQLLFIFLISLLFMSCRKDEINPSSGDYLIFGHFHGECAGESCVEIYKLEKNQLLEDAKDIYPSFSQFYEGNYVKLSQLQYDKAKDLMNNIPRDLWNESEKIIGQPDAGDWGGLYIEFKHKGKRKFWVLDKSKGNVPGKYHEFIDQVIQTINSIQ